MAEKLTLMTIHMAKIEFRYGLHCGYGGRPLPSQIDAEQPGPSWKKNGVCLRGYHACTKKTLILLRPDAVSPYGKAEKL